MNSVEQKREPLSTIYLLIFYSNLIFIIKNQEMLNETFVNTKNVRYILLCEEGYSPTYLLTRVIKFFRFTGFVK